MLARPARRVAFALYPQEAAVPVSRRQALRSASRPLQATMLGPLAASLFVAGLPDATAGSRPPSPPISCGAPAVDQGVANVQAFYDKSTTFKSDFQQRVWVKAYNHEKTSSGRVTFAKPGKMDWVYDDPRDNRVVSDGNVIKVYEADSQQMFEQPVDKSQYPAALSFLTGAGKLSDAFDFDLVCGDQMKFPGGYVLAGTPKQPTAGGVHVHTSTGHVRPAPIAP